MRSSLILISSLALCGCKFITDAEFGAAMGTGDTSTDESTAPACTITSPAANASLGFDLFTFVGTATDPEDGDLGPEDVDWSSDVDGVLGTGLSLSNVSLTDGAHVITCTATNSGALTGTASVSVISRSPYVEITSPADPTTVGVNERVSLVGEGMDLEDGGLALTWDSNIDGSISNPTQFRPTAGVHTITATATDSASNVATRAFTLTAQ